MARNLRYREGRLPTIIYSAAAGLIKARRPAPGGNMFTNGKKNWNGWWCRGGVFLTPGWAANRIVDSGPGTFVKQNNLLSEGWIAIICNRETGFFWRVKERREGIRVALLKDWLEKEAYAFITANSPFQGNYLLSGPIWITAGLLSRLLQGCSPCPSVCCISSSVRKDRPPHHEAEKRRRAGVICCTIASLQHKYWLCIAVSGCRSVSSGKIEIDFYKFITISSYFGRFYYNWNIRISVVNVVPWFAALFKLLAAARLRRALTAIKPRALFHPSTARLTNHIPG